jgi:hypothetical protein
MSGRNLFAPKEQAEPKPGRNLFKPMNMSQSLTEGIRTLVPEGKEDLEKYGYRSDLPWERQSRRFREYYEAEADRELQGRRALLGPFAENDTTENLTNRAKALAAKNEFKLPGRNTPEPKMGMGQAFVTGAADVGRLVPGGKQLVQSMGEAVVGDPSLDYSKVVDASTTRALVDRPMTTRGGQIATLLAPGAAIAKGVTMAPRAAAALMSPAVAARVAGKSLLAQGVRYTGRGAVLAGAGAADYYLYNAAAEAGNIAKLEGQETPDLGQRLNYASSQVFTPGGLIAAGTGPLISGAYRTGRAAVAGTKNLATTGTLRRAIPQQSAKPQIVGTRSDLFTPSDVQKRVGAISATTKTRTGRTAREEAIDLVLAKGFQPDEAEKLVKLISYDNYASVDEMLFELASADVDQLTVAMGRIGGDAKKTLREAFKARNANMPDQIRVALRDAMGLSGDDLEDFAKQMATRADEATSEGYAAAYATQVSDDTWAKIWDRFRASPDAAAALAAASRLARNSYRGNPAQLEVARQLDELAGALRSPDVTPPKLSTHALDYLDRGFGSLIAGEKKNNKAFAASLIEIQKAIRNAGLDADTGLNGPREVYSQYMAASRALDYGAKAFGRGTPLRDIKKQFAASLKDADEVFEDIAGEGQSIIDQALIMGWLRGAEDAVETATNPGALIRQIYGSERQRAKLLEMMPKLSDQAAAGVKGDQTKRIRALVGGKRSDGKGTVESIFERQRRMLESQGRVSGNSQTADAQEAIFAQGGRQRLVNTLVGALMNPQDAARNAALWAVERVTTPAIFKPAVNKELGDILSTRGRDELLAVIAEIRARQIATGKGPKPAAPPPAGGGTPSNTPTPPPAGGTPAANALAQKPGKLGTRTADAAAIATLGLQGGTAEADTGGVSAELEAANERVALAEKTVADTRSNITKLQSQLEMLQDPNGDPSEKQRVLIARGHNLGTYGEKGDGVDGDLRPGGYSFNAIKAEMQKIEAEMARTRGELEKAQIAETKALDAAKQVRMQKIQADAQPGKNTELAREFGPYGGVAAGIAAAYLMRRGAGQKFAKASQTAADSANALLTRAPISLRAGVQHPNSINVRATKLNDFARQGGAPSGTTPFDDKQTGSFRPRAKKNTVDPSDLYPNPGFMASRLRIPDYGWSATGLIEAQVAGGFRAKEEKKIAEYEADVERFAAKGDEAGLQRASANLQQAKNMYAIALAFERAGYAYAGTRMLAGLKDPYKFVRPDIKGYEEEASSLRTAMNKK